MPGARLAGVEMTTARRRRLLFVATLVGIAAATFVGLYPSKRMHRAETTVVVATSDRPPATLQLGSRDVGRPGTLTRLTERAAAGEPLAVTVVSEADTGAEARSLLDGATQLVRGALETGTQPTLQGIAQAQADVTAAEGAVGDAVARGRGADAARALDRANEALDAAQARLARLESGSAASISVGPREERTVVAHRGFGWIAFAGILLAGALLLRLVAWLTRSRTPPTPDDEELRDVVGLPAPDPEPEARPEPERDRPATSSTNGGPPARASKAYAHVGVPAKRPKRR